MSSVNEWPTVKLGDIAEIKTTQIKPESLDGETIYLGLEHLKKDGGILEKSDIATAGLKSSKYEFTDEAILFGKLRPNLRKVATPDFSGICSTDILPIYPSETVNRSFLYHYLLSEPAQAFIRNRVTGINLPRTSPKALRELPISLPPLTEQQRIAKILDEIASNNGLKTSMLEKLSELEASMFENLAKQNRSATAPLSSLNVDFIAGKNIVASGESSHPLNQVVKVSAVSSGTFDPTEAKPLPTDYSPPEKHRIEKGDILFGRASGSLELIGATCLVTQGVEHLYLPDKIWKLEVGAESPVDPLFVYYALRGARSRSYFQNQASGASGVRNISKKKVLQLEIPVPSREDQRSFLNNAAHIREEKLQTKKSLVLGEELQNSLSTRAFAGQL